MTTRPLVPLLVLVVATGCASAGAGPTVGLSRTADDAATPPAVRPHSPADSGTDPLLGIDDSFHGTRLSDGNTLSDVGLLDELAGYDLVCVGERHDDPHHHWAQLAVLYGLSTRAQMSGRNLALGLEMIEHPFQSDLDQYTDGDLALDELTERVEWRSRWGYDFALYRPLFELAHSRHLPILGLNAPRETIRAVAKKGLRRLDPKTREELPEDLDLEDEAHQAAFDAAMAEHPHGGSPGRLYSAQVVWDETMAAEAARWLGTRQPARQMVVAAGLAHCRSFAIPSRVTRRLRDCRAVSVLPSQGPPSDADTVGYNLVMVLGSEQ